MGRKTNPKSKEKRQQRKDEQLRISHAMEVVKKANTLIDPMEPFTAFKKFDKNGVVAELFVKRGVELDESFHSWAFSLTKKNMQHKYEQCSWGWSDSKKEEELRDEAAWFLVAKSETTGTLLGFSHFRFDLDEGVEVLYCYELQLEPNVQRKSLGKFMMQVLELIAFKNNMRKVMLTVLKNNKFSKFFKAINYELDETSPVGPDEDEYPYSILSKINKRLPPLGIILTPNGKSTEGHHCCMGHHHHH